MVVEVVAMVVLVHRQPVVWRMKGLLRSVWWWWWWWTVVRVRRRERSDEDEWCAPAAAAAADVGAALESVVCVCVSL